MLHSFKDAVRRMLMHGGRAAFVTGHAAGGSGATRPRD